MQAGMAFNPDAVRTQGVSLTIRWNLRIISSCDTLRNCTWIDVICINCGTYKAELHNLAEILIKRRSSFIGGLSKRKALFISIKMVSSEKNKRDMFTHVPQVLCIKK